MPTLIVNETETQLIVVVEEARIDAAIATRFKDRLREIVLRGRKPVRLDMRRVDFMDSSGLGAMIAVRKALPEALPLVLEGLTPNVERVFRLTRMDSVFDIRPATTLQE
ncbi:anti-sigma factor antagonist [Paracoccus acridae]|uniref:Anti-sigma factor antagonist n=1 Tax=Paracoccus acridae TaxID=1795310 RepID=A0ABQ1VGF5_9RHOB|nr:STAS domain-containing protein [Paracoccus acridae]GGF63179.1 anti-sigma factor antagonist [Paracoccus acridae]